MSNKPEPFDELEMAEQSQQSQEKSPAATVEESVVPGDQAAEYLAGWKRAQADYQNLRKVVDQERSDMVKYANQGLLEELVPILSHFNMAFKSMSPEAKSSAWVKGFEHIANSFKQVLQQNGVTLIPTIGEQFNPAQHESVGEVASTEAEGKIVEEVATGFMLHGKVMQPAKVKISTGKSN